MIDRCLAIMKRRAALMGLDLQRGVYFGGTDSDADPQAIRVEIVGNPQIDRVRWLEEERERLLGLIPVEGSPTIN